MSKLDSCEFDVPVAYQLYPLVLQDVIKVAISLSLLLKHFGEREREREREALFLFLVASSIFKQLFEMDCNLR